MRSSNLAPTNNINVTMIPQINLLACKLTLDKFGKETFNFSQSCLQNAYNKATEINSDVDINFFKKGQYVYLVPQSGKGDSADMAIISLAMKLLS